MFVAWRDLRFARGRFVLIGTVVALITLLVGFLAGLTGGLASQNVSGVLALPGDRLVLQSSDGTAPTFGQSEITDAALAGWKDASGVTSVTSVGIAQTRAESGGQHVAVALFGMPASTATGEVTALAPTRDGDIGLSAGAAKDLGAAVGDSVRIAGTGYRVASIGADVWYSHTPIVAMTPKAWSSVDAMLGGDGRPTLLAVSGDADWSTVAASTGTSVATPLASLPHLETFRSEVGSLGLMIAMLFGVSALVVGAFFTVWTMQRAGDVAVLKALGASTRSLVRDALGQALVVLIAGTGIGLLAVVALGALAGSALPFALNPLTTFVPAAAMVLLGLVGAAVALRPVTAADPLTALGSNR